MRYWKFLGAAETFEQVMAVHARSKGKDKLSYWSAALKLGNLRLEQGKAWGVGDFALQFCDPAADDRAVPRKSPKRWMRSYIDAARAGALLARGRREEGRQLLEPLYRDLEKVPAGGSWRADWMRRLWRRHQL